MVDKSSSLDISIEEQRRAWNAWNAATREKQINFFSRTQADFVERYLQTMAVPTPAILEVGCGTGWLCERLSRLGNVTGTDLSDEVLARARTRVPGVNFVPGDFRSLDLPVRSYDVVVTLETLSHFSDQAAFVGRIADLLRPGGHVIIATQNRPVLERWSAIPGPAPGQIRHWVDAAGLRRLLSARFNDVRVSSICPVGDQGLLRIVNSPRLNALVGHVVPSATVTRLKERLMLGHTLLGVGIVRV